MTFKITLWEDGSAFYVRVLYNTTRRVAQCIANQMVMDWHRDRPRHIHSHSLEVLF